MAILGNNVKGSSTNSGLNTGRMYASKFTLASAATLNELHGWFGNGGSASTVQIVIYADSAGSPGARVAYTSLYTLTGSDIEIAQTGFSVALAAGDYWIGFRCESPAGSGNCWTTDTGGTHKGITGGTPSPPPDPFGTTNTSGTRNHSVWAVVGAAVSVPVADFTGTPLSGTAPLSVTFADASTNIPTSWAWTFGDGGTSTSQNPTHSYTTPGTYTVVLVATNSAGSNTKTRTGYVSVGGAPVADFTGTPLTGVSPLAVAFTDTSTNTPTSWAWTFGDGGTSTSQNPTHSYTSPGIYTVVLVATNAAASNTKTQTGYVTVGAGFVPQIIMVN